MVSVGGNPLPALSFKPGTHCIPRTVLRPKCRLFPILCSRDFLRDILGDLARALAAYGEGVNVNSGHIKLSKTLEDIPL
jgi:hypothetical protein